MGLYKYLQQGLNIVEFIALFLALILVLKFKGNRKFLIVFLILLLTVLIEYTSAYLSYLIAEGRIYLKSSWGLYNVYNILVYTLWFYLYSLLQTKNHRKICILAICVYLFTVFIESIFILDYTMYLQSIAHIVGSLLLAIVVILYFIDILREGSLEKLVDNPFFWISSGLLFYYVVNIPFRVVENNYLFSSETDFILIYMKLIGANVMYLLICIGIFKCLRKG